MFSKRVCLLTVLCFIIYNSVCFAVDVSTFDDLMSTYTDSSSECEINLQDNIDANCNLGCPGAHNVIIHGNGCELNGNDCGGIILENGCSLDIDGICAKNFHSNHGAVIDNDFGCCANNINGTFSNNLADIDGGVIFSNSNIYNINGEFSNNMAYTNGGAIYNNYNGQIDNIQGLFSNNNAVSGTGGAISNLGIIGDIHADFNGNKAERTNGGAIMNFGSIGCVSGNFSNNYSGGADSFLFSPQRIKDLYIKNQTNLASDILGGGGAIMNYGDISKLSGSFINNTTDGYGGAIRNSFGTINMVSDEEGILFSGNTDSTGSNAIYNDNGIINMNTGDYDIIINDKISGEASFMSPEININKDSNGSGKIIINNTVSDNTINMYNGSLNFNEYNDAQGNIDKTGIFNYYGGTVDLRSNDIRNTNFGNLNLYADMDLVLDGSFEDLKIDTISADSFEANGHNIDISDILLRSTTDEKKFSVSPIGDNVNENVKQLLQDAIIYSAGDVINSPIYKYNTSYDPMTGLITFERLENGDIYSPSVYATPVAAQIGGYLQQLNTYEDVFRRMSTYMLMNRAQRLNMKFNNKYADAANNSLLKYSDREYSSKYGWFSPYSIFENVPLKNGPKVSNVAYGTFAGIESEMIELNNNWDFIGSIYSGYNGSHQAYNGIDINQNGGTVGILGMAYKGDFFSGITANIGANGCEADTQFGKDNFSMLMAGIASKSGYNFEFKDGKFIIQPNYLMSYTFVNAFSYNNSSGVKLNIKPLNAIQIAPGIQFIGNFENGWQPYLNVNMVFNIIDKTEIKANDISLPQLSVKPFIVYGLGVRKLWGERFSGFIQAYITNGGRNGVGLQFGARWQLGE